MTRELREITLPSGKKAKIITAFTFGERNKIQGELLNNSEISTNSKSEDLKITPKSMFSYNEILLEVAVKEIDNQVSSLDVINSLSVSDGDFLLTEVQKIDLGGQIKKKS